MTVAAMMDLVLALADAVVCLDLGRALIVLLFPWSLDVAGLGLISLLTEDVTCRLIGLLPKGLLLGLVFADFRPALTAEI